MAIAIGALTLILVVGIAFLHKGTPAVSPTPSPTPSSSLPSPTPSIGEASASPTAAPSSAATTLSLPVACIGSLATLSASPADARSKMPYLTNGALNVGIVAHDQLAYVVATAEWETAHFETMEEYYNSADDLDQAYDGEIGNGAYPSTDGFTYRGRGYVQLTGRANYQKMGTLLGIDLVDNPVRAEDPYIAGQIAAIGMSQGLFTGAKLADYISPPTVNFVGARAIVNGSDQASTIAGYATGFSSTLLSCNGGILQ